MPRDANDILRTEGVEGLRTAWDEAHADARPAATPSHRPTASSLRPYQAAALEALRKAFAEGAKRPLLQLPTGGGKTVIAAAIARQAVERGNRVVFTAPRKLLIDQTVNRFYREGVYDIGVMQADHPLTRPDAAVQVASMQTLIRRAKPPTDLVIVDEAHMKFDAGFAWLDTLDVPVVGLSATPWTKGLGKHFDRLVVGMTIGQLIADKWLVPPKVFGPGHVDLAGVRTVAGDYHEGDLAKAMNKPSLVADVVQTWLERGEGRRTMCFAVDCAHAEALHRQFNAKGVGAAYMDAYTPDRDREAIRRQLERGDISVVCNVTVLTTGIDWPFVDCIILARPTKSDMLYVQIIGRGLRIAPGKENCLVLDHSDTTESLGFVTDIVHERLDDGKERRSTGTARDKGPPLPKPCPSCTYLKPPKVHICPNCGFEPKRQSDVIHADGQLVELTGKQPVSWSEEQRWYSGLTYIQHERGYARGWVAYKMKEKFGRWPRHGLRDIPEVPDPDIRNWEHSRRIAWAKSDGKAASYRFETLKKISMMKRTGYLLII